MSITIKSLKDYVNYIMQKRKEMQSDEFYSHRWFFRGQEDATWSVKPNVFRNDEISLEDYVIDNALRQNPFDFYDSKSDFEILTKLQHYGLGTRLLDVTLNPLVALYFATAPAISYKPNKNGQFTQTKNDGVVFLSFSPWHSSSELCIRIAAALPFIHFENNYTIGQLIGKLSEKGVITEDNKIQLIANDCTLLIRYLQESYFAISSHSNERLIRQNGAFVIPTAINIYPEDNILNSRIEKSRRDMRNEFVEEDVHIPSNCKELLREELDFFNINEATLFPELEHQMTYIKQTNISQIGRVPDFKLFSKEKETVLYNDLIPNIDGTIENIVPQVSTQCKIKLKEILYEQTNFIDWKLKDNIKATIIKECKRLLQGEQCFANSEEISEIASKILSSLLNPSKNQLPQLIK